MTRPISAIPPPIPISYWISSQFHQDFTTAQTPICDGALPPDIPSRRQEETMTIRLANAIRTTCLAGAVVLATCAGTRADTITDWNAKAETIAIEKRMLPPPNARGMAILHIAMFEA